MSNQILQVILIIVISFGVIFLTTLPGLLLLLFLYYQKKSKPKQAMAFYSWKNHPVRNRAEL